MVTAIIPLLCNEIRNVLRMKYRLMQIVLCSCVGSFITASTKDACSYIVRGCVM